MISAYNFFTVEYLFSQEYIEIKKIAIDICIILIIN